MKRIDQISALAEGLTDTVDSLYCSLAGTGDPVAGDADGREAAKLRRQLLAKASRLDPRAHYNEACRLADPRGVHPSPPREIVHHLRIAATDPDLRDSMLKDPRLRAILHTAAFLGATCLPRPRSDLLTVTPFSRHATALQQLGLTQPEDILATAPGDLAEHLSTSDQGAKDLRAMAELAQKAQQHVTPLALEVVDWFARKGVDSVADVVTRRDQEPKLAHTIMGELQDTCSFDTQDMESKGAHVVDQPVRCPEVLSTGTLLRPPRSGQSRHNGSPVREPVI